MSSMNKVGFIGLGTMGIPMALNIYKAGYPLGVYNRNAEKTQSFREKGIAVYASPAELAAHSDVIIIMVFGPQALEDVLSGATGLCSSLKENTAVINMSTVSREATLRAAEAVALKKAWFLDAPVAGSKKPAEDGTLTILAGGPSDLVERMTPLLKSMGKEIIYCGAIGQGTSMKLFINLLLGTLMQCFAEALCLGKKLGLQFSDMQRTVESSAMTAPLFKVKGDAIGRGDFSKNFSVDLILKDLSLILEVAGKEGIPLPVSAAAREMFSAAHAMGLGSDDMCAVIKVLETLSGIQVRQ